jgi:hypothetical protein
VVTVVDFKLQFLTLVGLNPASSREETFQLAYEVLVILVKYLFVPEILHGVAPEVVLQH